MISGVNKKSRLAIWIVAVLISKAIPSQAQETALVRAELRTQLSPVGIAMLSSEMAGKIHTLAVVEGQRVEAGDLLASFDCSIQEAQLEKAEIKLDISRNNLKASKRMRELNAIGGIEYANAELDVSSAHADIRYLMATLKRCLIIAPFSGSIGDIEVNANEFVPAGTPMIEILDVSSLKMEFIAPSNWLEWLSPGMKFEVYLEDTGQIYQATIDRLAAKVDAMSQSIKVVASIIDNYPDLLPGMSGRVRISRNNISE